MPHNSADVERILREKIRAIPDYPKRGIIFRDITPLLKDKNATKICIDEMAKRLSRYKIDYVVGIEARGFIFGSLLAYKLGAGFVPARKKGKLPYSKISRDYALEYGNETLEMHDDAVERQSNVVVVDDLLATGGTASAAGALVESLGGRVVAYAFVVELKDLGGRSKLTGKDIVSIVTY
ncbi:MAG: adenine phosphoribosyltransferase [Candidatus Micrarchaeota archaeon]|nr:adenine phosphoribosyltransferase [Candidatus Micrarchaeota archaeon]